MRCCRHLSSATHTRGIDTPTIVPRLALARPAAPPATAAARRSHSRTMSSEGPAAKRMRLAGASPANGQQAQASAFEAAKEQGQAAVRGRHSLPPFRVPGLTVTDHTIVVPLDYTGKIPGDLTVFAREIVAGTHTSSRHTTPYLLFLQGAPRAAAAARAPARRRPAAPSLLTHPRPVFGPPRTAGGPGFEAPRPTEASGWIRSAVSRFRVVLMDQRGTGSSTPVTVANLAKRGTPEEQAAYLGCFRCGRATWPHAPPGRASAPLGERAPPPPGWPGRPGPAAAAALRPGRRSPSPAAAARPPRPQGGQHRAGRRAGAPDAGAGRQQRRALERHGPVLWRLLRPDLPLLRAPGWAARRPFACL
jgi:hypothetical protein